jgi:adenylate kinase
LVTGPPNNGRDEYIETALPELKKHGKIGYYHVFDYMQKNAQSCSITGLNRESVFDLPKAKLIEIRDKAFSQIIDEIKESSNSIDIVSTPSVFKTPARLDYYDGMVEGLNGEMLRRLKPDLLVFFIDDLLRVRTRIRADPLRKKLGKLKLKDIAEWRESSLKVPNEYVEQTKAKRPSLVFIIFARQHPTSTFTDLVLGKKPRIYLSYHITGEEEFEDVQRLSSKLSASFVCIDPYAIKDWQIVNTYDEAVKKSKKAVTIKIEEADRKFTVNRLSLEETNEAIDLIRSQIVQRDLEIIANVHATVVYHRSEKPSYGVMVEVFHSTNMVHRPVYVLYPFKVRLSPFFENYVQPQNMIQGEGEVTRMEDELVSKLRREYKKWPTWSPIMS